MSKQLIPDATDNNTCVFVGGLKATFTESLLYNFFGRFGDVLSVNLKRSKKMKSINRGFCIIKFKSRKVAERVIKVKDHFIKKRCVTCRPYLKGVQLKESKCNKNDRKIYISSLPKNTSNEDIQELFARFGKVETGYSLKDDETGQSKGFGFVTFEEKGAVEKVLKEGDSLEIKGVRIGVARFMAQKEEEEQMKEQEQPLAKPKEDKSLKASGLSKKSNSFYFDPTAKLESKVKTNSANRILQPSNKCYPPFQGSFGPKPCYKFDQLQASQNHPSRMMPTCSKNIFDDLQIKQQFLPLIREELLSKKEINKKMPQKILKNNMINIKIPKIKGMGIEHQQAIPHHPSLVHKTYEQHQLRPTSSQYFKDFRNISAKAWHDLSVSNIELRLTHAANPGLAPHF